MQIEYATISKTENNEAGACGCGSGGCGCHSTNVDSTTVDPNLPERFQLLQEGDRVVEFGSGTGSDCIHAARIVGPKGKVIGIDHSEINVSRARENVDKQGIPNLEFRLGNIQNAPVSDEFADVIYANCVFNLQKDKQKVADEMYRVAKHNGYVCVSDFVILEDIPEALREEAGDFAGCIRGAEKAQTFMEYFRKTGFQKGGIVEVNKVRLPDEMLQKHLSSEWIEKYNDINSDYGIFSVVLVVEKPETCTAETCCHNPDKHKN